MFYIAEAGSNWFTSYYASDETNMKTVVKMVRAANAAGATAIKFQMFRYDDMYKRPTLPEWKMYEFQRLYVAIAAATAQDIGIEFMCTPFDLNSAEFLNPYILRWKLASSDVNNKPLIDYMIATKKPIIASTGYIHNRKESPKALQYLQKNVENLTLLYCISEYPAIINEPITLSLEKRYAPHVGFSDHTKTSSAALTALEHGAAVFEKHFKLRNSNSPDTNHSITTTELKNYYKDIKKEQKRIQKENK